MGKNKEMTVLGCPYCGKLVCECEHRPAGLEADDLEVMTPENRERKFQIGRFLDELKEWQVLAGRFAALANHLANIIIEAGYEGKIKSNELDDANEAIDEVSDYLAFDESE